MTAAFWTGVALGMFAGALAGGFVVCLFAAFRVTQAEAEVDRWREAAGDKQRLRVTWAEARR